MWTLSTLLGSFSTKSRDFPLVVSVKHVSRVLCLDSEEEGALICNGMAVRRP